MGITEIIARKRDGFEHTLSEIETITMGYIQNTVSPEQMSAWLMAIVCRGMTYKETALLTDVMVGSGECIDLSSLSKPTIDKHSTGGVGDKTSLVVVPVLASCGAFCVKMSGRGLGLTGGTLDKLQSIPGYRVEFSASEMLDIVKRAGCCIAGQSSKLVPADKKIYALRDVTATVPSLPLIASSIMSKKIAGGCQTIIIDLKVGSGAFINTKDEAQKLADLMVKIGETAGRKTIVKMTDMNNVLGRTVGNALEVKEAINTLKPNAEKDERFYLLCKALCASALTVAGLAKNNQEAGNLFDDAIADGQALKTFEELVKIQGGNPDIIHNTDLLPRAPVQYEIIARESGFIHQVEAKSTAEAVFALGAGRMRKEDDIDFSVGVEFAKGIGCYMEKNEIIGFIHAKSITDAQRAEQIMSGAVVVKKDPADALSPIIAE